ncbi:hypothetical protein AM501_07965 [Aneurinibacillus migulanus]|uniref:DUF418 domain-containing protein n=2 Tax=Aneurinibacillus migulanus TaxID=47500 RepID=A0A0D1X827_ANEMI|nr:DUF418 domain-containing protein [Aneurinibacillus migulanus]KIV50591.1 hypothetical protein TS64_26855 [Aneurinibacillus migulanus]KIV57209.1 hypothetical protein TS65_10550 [Aneurinibacillus migulanus]KON96898.1 hypothetical protein AF333_16835 [Aneurinibacillus migulanus]KPD08786.1 hypothetical protein AM501_07965 [Aneurinibacillus migulanus]MED4731716.1 DUF418 domain-containing protein [Aneurinibacillus migulanus]
MKITPISRGERMITLDIIRGFALLGIFLVNMPTFHSPDFIRQLYDLPQDLSSVDKVVSLFFNLFIQTKFYTIFSFLFGLGFYVFMNRAEQKGLKVYRLFSRRLLILFLFGLLHLIFLWYGDILHAYAIVGFALLLFYKRSNKVILGWAFGLLFVFYCIPIAQLLFESPSYITEKQTAGITKLNEAVKIYQDATYVDWLAYRVKTEVAFVLESSPIMVFVVLPMFLFGLYAGQKGIFQQPAEHTTFVRRVWSFSLLLSVPLTMFVACLELGLLSFGIRQSIVSQLFVSLSGLTLCFFYISSLILLVQKDRWQKRLRIFSFTGQMALTNYVMQTMVSLLIIFTFHLFNNISLAVGFLLCLVIYLFQAIFSFFWLKRYKFGPLEWLWRSLTYGYVQPIKHKQSPF